MQSKNAEKFMRLRAVSLNNFVGNEIYVGLRNVL
jgi:hypothetical protein